MTLVDSSSVKGDNDFSLTFSGAAFRGLIGDEESRLIAPTWVCSFDCKAVGGSDESARSFAAAPGLLTPGFVILAKLSIGFCATSPVPLARLLVLGFGTALLVSLVAGTLFGL